VEIPSQLRDGQIACRMCGRRDGIKLPFSSFGRSDGKARRASLEVGQPFIHQYASRTADYFVRLVGSNALDIGSKHPSVEVSERL